MSDQYLDFIRVQLQKCGFDVTEVAKGFKITNVYLKGLLQLKPLALTWSTKPGYEIADVPRANGNTTKSFKSIAEALSFISLNLAKKSK